VAFIQKLFSTRQNYANGNTRIGERDRIWYDDNTNTLRIQLDNTPGGTIIGFSGVTYKGLYNVTTNTPAISDATGLAGWEWTVSGSGTRNFGNGPIVMQDGDLLIHNGSHYDLIPGPRTQLQANWTETNSSLVSFILNKPVLATVATSGSYTDLTNKPTIPAAQIQSDWTQATTSALDYIKNKPNLTIKSTRLVTTATYLATTSDYYIGVNRAGAVAITLPTPGDGYELVIKDESGACTTYPISIVGTIDNDAGGATLSINNGALHLIYRSGWRII
jgi:hypothetical protein